MSTPGESHPALIVRDAAVSADGMYRYWLSRRWGHGPAAVFIMLNPSTADAADDDPTIRRCVGFARTWGYNAVEVVNRFAFRATNPADLLTAADPVGPDNGRWVESTLTGAGVAVAAWGANKALRTLQSTNVERLALHLDVRLDALGVTKDGSPRHPLYVKADASLMSFGGAR